MAMTVLADAQFGLTRILRPYADFENDYQGVTISRPIMLSQVLRDTGGTPLDDLAIKGEPGYSPQLMRGLQVPYGARCVFYFPKFVSAAAGNRTKYIWTLIWRLRNVHDFRVGRIPFHYPKQAAGVPDTSSGSAEARVVIPAAYQSLPYAESIAAAGLTDRVQTDVRLEEFTFGGDDYGALPFLPGAVLTGQFQQGLLDPGDPTFGDEAVMPSYQILEQFAAGDEVLISLRRDATTGANWDFAQPPAAGADSTLSLLLGNANGGGTAFPDIGVYVNVGSAP